MRPGATLGVLINGRRRTLTIVGIALSPEYVFGIHWTTSTTPNLDIQQRSTLPHVSTGANRYSPLSFSRWPMLNMSSATTP